MAVYTIIRVYEVPAENRIEATERMLEALMLKTERDFHVRDYIREPYEKQERARWRMRKRESKPMDRLRALEGKITLMCHRSGDIRGGRTGTRDHIIRPEDYIWYPANVYTWFIWIRAYPDIDKLLIPYRTAKFTETWKHLMADGQAAKTSGKGEAKDRKGVRGESRGDILQPSGDP